MSVRSKCSPRQARRGLTWGRLVCLAWCLTLDGTRNQGPIGGVAMQLEVGWCLWRNADDPASGGWLVRVAVRGGACQDKEMMPTVSRGTRRTGHSHSSRRRQHLALAPSQPSWDLAHTSRLPSSTLQPAARSRMASLYDDALGSSRMLSSSISSMSSSRQQTSQIAKAYRQAAQLFLTRRLPEALSTIEPIITPPAHDYANGTYNGDLSAFAPVASASRGTRVKVWSFYLTFLNSVIELGAEEGKHAFGSTRWKELVSRCRDGSVWDDVVRDGYAGVEGDVDAEVVINL